MCLGSNKQGFKIEQSARMRDTLQAPRGPVQTGGGGTCGNLQKF